MVAERVEAVLSEQELVWIENDAQWIDAPFDTDPPLFVGDVVIDGDVFRELVAAVRTANRARALRQSEAVTDA